MTSDWTEDAALGVAVREARGALEVRALSVAGDHAIQRAARAAYGAPSRYLYPTGGVWHIGELHRLAFARALSPLTPELNGGCDSISQRMIHGERWGEPLGEAVSP